MITAAHTRRQVLQRMAFTALGTLAGSAFYKNATGAERSAKNRRAVKPSSSDIQAPLPSPSLALSLRVLQEQAAKMTQARRPLSKPLAYLGGMNRIHGVMSEPDGEVLLLGERDPSLPIQIHLDDVSIAIRNAYQVSAAYQGAPGCTIDPWPEAQDPWRIQMVKILGMPPSAMADRHVSLDYELKRVSAGLSAPGNGITSLYEMARMAAPPCAEGAKAGQQTSVTHRFWFYPRYSSPPRFLAEAGMVLIVKPVQVQLLTEQTFLDQTGKRTGAAPASSQAEQFAAMITQFLATHHSGLYGHLASDFRVIEVGKLIQYQQVPAASLRYLLLEHPVQEVPVQGFVAGVRREERSEIVCGAQITEQKVSHGVRIESHEQIQEHYQIFRGGVEARIHLAAEQFTDERAGVLSDLQRRVRASRLSSGAFLWPITA
jgi:hypothetical protein